MAHLKMLAHRLGVRLAWAVVGACAIGAAYLSGDAAYALGRVVGAG